MFDVTSMWLKDIWGSGGFGWLLVVFFFFILCDTPARYSGFRKRSGS